MKLLPKNVFNKKVERTDKKLQTCTQAEFKNRQEQLLILVEKISNRRYFKKVDTILNFNCFLTHLKTRCVRSPIYVLNQNDTPLHCTFDRRTQSSTNYKWEKESVASIFRIWLNWQNWFTQFPQETASDSQLDWEGHQWSNKIMPSRSRVPEIGWTTS